MKRKFVSVILAAMMVASLTVGCGGGSDTKEDTSAPAAEAEDKADAADEKEEAAPEESEDSENSEDFTLLDVSTDMVSAGVYAVNEDQIELVFTMFTEPSGTPMASLFLFAPDGSGDVICGTYTAETETDEDNIGWTLLTVDDVYTGEQFTIGFGETDDGKVYIFDNEGGTYEGEYLDADETINYMGAAVALITENE